MDISIEPVLRPEKIQSLTHPLHGVCRIPEHTRAQEQPFYIIPLVELYDQIAQLLRFKCRSWHIIASAVQTVLAVIYTVVRHKDLKQRYTSSIRCKAVTYTT